MNQHHRLLSRGPDASLSLKALSYVISITVNKFYAIYNFLAPHSFPPHIHAPLCLRSLINTLQVNCSHGGPLGGAIARWTLAPGWISKEHSQQNTKFPFCKINNAHTFKSFGSGLSVGHIHLGAPHSSGLRELALCVPAHPPNILQGETGTLAYLKHPQSHINWSALIPPVLLKQQQKRLKILPFLPSSTFTSFAITCPYRFKNWEQAFSLG